MKSYAGIGSRNTPEQTRDTLVRLGAYLGQKGYELYSGHADGADISFETGCDAVDGSKSIFLPWRGFEGSTSQYYNISDDAYKVLEKYRPNYKTFSQGTQKLLARDVYQVLGYKLDTPVKFVVCWTESGKLKGGTALAIQIAMDNNIPVYNLGKGQEELQRLVDYIEGDK